MLFKNICYTLRSSNILARTGADRNGKFDKKSKQKRNETKVHVVAGEKQSDHGFDDLLGIGIEERGCRVCSSRHS